MPRQKATKRRIASRFGIVFTERLDGGMRYLATDAKGDSIGFIHKQGSAFIADGCNGRFSGIGEAAIAMLAKAAGNA